MSLASYFQNPLSRGDVQRVGLAGFETTSVVNEVVERKAQTPTVFLEDGTPAQTSVVRDPVTLSISGDVADVFVKGESIEQIFERSSQAVGLITQYLPEETQATRQRAAEIRATINEASNRIDQITRDGKQLATFAGSQDAGHSNSSKFIEQFEAYYNGGELIVIETAKRVYENMVIQSFITERDNTTESLKYKLVISEFLTAEANYQPASGLIGRAADGINGQADSQSDEGVQSGEEVESSLASTTLTALKEAFGG